MDRWEPLLEAGADPRRAAAQASAAGRRVVAAQCPLVPPELIHALGLSPWRLSAPPTPPDQTSHQLQTFCCSWIQAILDQALKGSLSHLTGVVLSCTPCDSMRSLPDIWRRSVSAPRPDWLYTIKFPAHRDGEEVGDFVSEELAIFQRWLELRAGEVLEPDRLAASAALFNRIRAALRALQRLTAQQQIPASTFQQAAIGAQVMDPAEAAELLELLLEHAAAGELRPPERSPRLMLVAGQLDDLRLLMWLEEKGATCVAIESCNMNHFFEASADLDPVDPLADLSRRHGRRPPCATCSGSADLRGRRLHQTINELGVQGVVFLPLRGCDPHEFDNALMTAGLEPLGVPHLTLEIDPQWSSWGQLTNRLEAFLELVGGLPDAE